METYDLDQSWCLWYHSINDNNWDKSSYKLLLTIDNLYDLKIMQDYIKNEYFHNSMLFLMKSGIFPNWEDEKNKEGSCISLKIAKKEIMKEWEQITLLIISNELFLFDSKNEKINGVSISPKREFNIFKIWFCDNVKNLKGIINRNPVLINKNYMYKKNQPIKAD